MSTYLYETAIVLADGTTNEQLRLSLGRGFNAPDGPGYFAPVLGAGAEGVTVDQQVYTQQLQFGVGDRSVGNIRGVASADYDYLLTAGFGRPATLRFAPDDNDYSSSFVIARGVAANAVVQQDYFDIGWYDANSVLDVPVSEGTFAGTNSGSTGLEGLATDIKGQRKPRSWGRPRNIAPVLVNAPLRIYAWNYNRTGSRAPSLSVEAVRVRGADWTFYGNYADSNALAAASISVGFYGTCLAESLIRMGGSTAVDGSVRLDVTVTNQTAVQIARTLLLDNGIAPEDIDDTLYNAAVSHAPYVVQVYTTAEESYRDTINAVLSSALVWLCTDNVGVYRFGFFPALAPAPDFALLKFGHNQPAGDSDLNLLDVTVDLDTSNKNIPAKAVTVRYYRQEPLSNDAIASGVSDTVRATLAQEWRSTAKLENTTIEAIYPNAEEVVFDTLLIDGTDAQALATKLLSIVGKNIPNFTVSVALRDTLPQIGDTVSLVYPRFLASTGVICKVIGSRINVRASVAELRLWSLAYV